MKEHAVVRAAFGLLITLTTHEHRSSPSPNDGRNYLGPGYINLPVGHVLQLHSTSQLGLTLDAIHPPTHTLDVRRGVGVRHSIDISNLGCLVEVIYPGLGLFLSNFFMNIWNWLGKVPNTPELICNLEGFSA